MEKKLTIEQKLAIARTRGQSSRELARNYGVHHSTIADIQNEGEQVLSRYWQKKAKQIGRPGKKVQPEQIEMDELKKENEELRHDLALKQMRIDYLELKLKWQEERLAEAKLKKEKQLKKKKKQS